MRGSDERPGAMFSYVSLEERVPPDHPLRAIRRITDRALERISPELGSLYIHFGRPSIPPERLLRALVLQALYTIRSERQLMEQLDYNLLFRWFVGLGIDDAVWSPTTFSKNRDRLLTGNVAAAFFDAVLIHADTARLLSDEHFTVDGTLLEAWASQKSFRPRDQDPPAPSLARWSLDLLTALRLDRSGQAVVEVGVRLVFLEERHYIVRDRAAHPQILRSPPESFETVEAAGTVRGALVAGHLVLRRLAGRGSRSSAAPPVKLLVDMNLSPSWRAAGAPRVRGRPLVHYRRCDGARLRNPDVGERPRLRPGHERSRLLLDPRCKRRGDAQRRPNPDSGPAL
jgi:transposase